MGLETKYLYSEGKGTYREDEKRVHADKGSKFFSFDIADECDLSILQATNQFYEFTSKFEMDKKGGLRGASINYAIPLVNFERIK